MVGQLHARIKLCEHQLDQCWYFGMKKDAVADDLVTCFLTLCDLVCEYDVQVRALDRILDDMDAA